MQESLIHNCIMGVNLSYLEFSWMLVRAAAMAYSPLLWSCQTGPQKGFPTLLPFGGPCPALFISESVHCRMGRMEHNAVHQALAFIRMTSCHVHKSLPKGKTTAAGNGNSGKYQNKTKIFFFKTPDKINLLLLYWASQNCIRGKYGLSLFEGLGVKLSPSELQLLVASVYMCTSCISELLRSSLSKKINARKNNLLNCKEKYFV